MTKSKLLISSVAMFALTACGGSDINPDQRVPTDLPEQAENDWTGTVVYVHNRDRGNGETRPSSGPRVHIHATNEDQTILSLEDTPNRVASPGTFEVPAVTSDFDHVIISSLSNIDQISITEHDGDILDPVSGHYFLFQPTESLPDLGARAQYTGILLGDYHDSDQIIAGAASGTVKIDVDFVDSQIDAVLDIQVEDEDWAIVSFDIPLDQSQTGNVEFEGEFEGDGFSSADLRGLFAGSDASEVAGNFHLNSEPEFRDNGEVTGVFAASKD